MSATAEDHRSLLSRIFLIQTEPVYKLNQGPNEKYGGTYNFYVLFILAMIGAGWGGLVDWRFMLFLIASLLIALFLDDSSWKVKIALESMPSQMSLYCKLLVKVAQDLWFSYAIALLFFFLVEPMWHSGLAEVFPWTATSSFWLLYGFYFVVQLFFLIKYIFIILSKWETYDKPPFRLKKYNLATKQKALKHVIWSFFLSNIGLTVRCGSQVATLFVFRKIQLSLGLENITSGFQANYPAVFWGVAIACVLPWLLFVKLNVKPALYNYYVTHRTLHEVKSLYDSIHRIHHKATFPTILDSGTISPAEFAITEYSAPIIKLLPQPLWVLLEMFLAVTGHFSAHHTVLSKDNEKSSVKNSKKEQVLMHHHYHHRLFNCNYGLGLEGGLDVKFGTKV